MCSLRAEYTVDEGMGIVVPSLEEAMAPHSSTLAWKIPGTGSLVGLPSMVSHRVGHD